MSKRRRSGSRGSRSGAKRPRRGPDLEPSPERLAQNLARDLAGEARRAFDEVECSLAAEMSASSLISTWNLGPGTLIDEDPDEIFGLPFVTFLERAGDKRALAALRAIAAVASERIGLAAGKAADGLAGKGVAEPAWGQDLGGERAIRAMEIRDAVFDDSANIFIEFERADEAEPYAIGMLIDHNLGGFAKELLVGPSLEQVRETMERVPQKVAGTGELQFRDISLAEAAARCGEALWRTEHTLNPPVGEDFRDQLAGVAAHLRGLPETDVVFEPEEVSQAERAAAVVGFLATPAAKAFHDPGAAADLAELAVGYCADHLEGEGRPLRWSATVCELFCLYFLPRKVVRDPSFFERTVPALLPEFVRYAGEARGIPEAAITEAVAAAEEFTDEMVATVADEANWGPAKALAMEAMEAGVDIGDEAEMQSFIDSCNRRDAA